MKIRKVNKMKKIIVIVAVLMLAGCSMMSAKDRAEVEKALTVIEEIETIDKVLVETDSE